MTLDTWWLRIPPWHLLARAWEQTEARSRLRFCTVTWPKDNRVRQEPVLLTMEEKNEAKEELMKQETGKNRMP